MRPSISVSCASAGNCAAGGLLTDGSRPHHRRSWPPETNGTWHAAIEVPGTGGAEQGRQCGRPFGVVRLGGQLRSRRGYTDGSGHHQAFVASETNGTWHAAIEVPGTAALNKRGGRRVSSVSCASAGNCAAVGGYKDSSRHHQAFVASETNGTWHPAIEVPGTAALNKGGVAGVSSVSCASAGNCAAGGGYTDGSRHFQAFVASETNGTWHPAIEVPGPAALNIGRSADVMSVSCTSAWQLRSRRVLQRSGQRWSGVRGQRAGRRLAQGDRGARHGRAELARSRGRFAVMRIGRQLRGRRVLHRPLSGQAFVASEANGTWRTAIEVPGTAALNKGGAARVVVGVVRLGWQLRGRRALHGRLGPPPGLRRQRGQRHLARGDRGARHGHAEQRRQRRCPLGVVRVGGQLRGRRVLHRPLRSHPGLRGQPDLTRRRRVGVPRVQFVGRLVRLRPGSEWPCYWASC